MGFADDLSALGDRLDGEKNAHQRATAARAAASSQIQRRIDEVRTFLMQRGIGPFPVLRLPAPVQPNRPESQRRGIGFSRHRAESSTVGSPAVELLAKGWNLRHAAFIDAHGGLYQPMFSSSHMLLPPGVQLNEKGILLDHFDEMVPMPFDANSIVPVVDFGVGERGRQNYQKFCAEGWATIPVPDGIQPQDAFRWYLGVTHDGVPVSIDVHKSEGTVNCTATSLDHQWKMSIELIVR